MNATPANPILAPSAAAASTPGSQEPRTVRPRTDVVETKDALILTADLPGADESSIDLRLEEDVLVLLARPLTTEPEGWSLAWSEFGTNPYERRFRIGAEIDPAGIEAQLESGRLRVTLKKRQPTSAHIPIRTA